MCNCIEETRKQLTAHVDPELKKEVGFQKITHSGFVNGVLLMASGKIKTPIVIPFEIEYERKSKKSGKVRVYKKKVNYFPSFCPLCGEKYDQEG